MEANPRRIPNLPVLKTDSGVFMQLSDCTRDRLAGILIASLLVFAVSYVCFSSSPGSRMVILIQQPATPVEHAIPKDELETVLEKASVNKTVIISVLNKAYVKKGGMLDLFLRSMREGEGTGFLIKHLLLVSVDRRAFKRCMALGLHCYQLGTDDVDFSKEAIYMTQDFIKMMWRRTLFLGDVLRKGYNFVFTDMDVMWLRNPFTELSPDKGDIQISCDGYNGRPWDTSNFLNTGFYYTISNNRTIKLFDEWYESRNRSADLKDQDVLAEMKMYGKLNELGIRARFLDTLYFSGFCQDSKDFGRVITVHANCCRSVKAKLADIRAAIDVWKKFNCTGNATWPEHKACAKSWTQNINV